MIRLRLSFALILLVLALGLSSASHAENQKELQGPTPSTRVSGKPEQKQPATAKENPQEYERGTENNPFVIKGVPPSTKTPQEAEEDRRERDKKATFDEILTFYTGWQAAFAGMMFITAFIQVILFVWQLSIMNQTLNTSKLSADAAADTASYLVNSERAYVFAKVKFAEAIFPTHEGNGRTLAHAIFVNHGKTPAIIIGMSGVPYFIEPNEISAIQVRDTPVIFPAGLVIASGNTYKFKIDVFVSHKQLAMLKERSIRLCCSGQIRYKDIFKKEWVTGYCWEYILRENRFTFCTDATHLNYCREYEHQNA